MNAITWVAAAIGVLVVLVSPDVAIWRRAIRPLLVPTVTETAIIDALLAADPPATILQLFDWERDRLFTLSKGAGATSASAAIAIVTAALAADAEDIPAWAYYGAGGAVAVFALWAGLLLVLLRGHQEKLANELARANQQP